MLFKTAFWGPLLTPLNLHAVWLSRDWVWWNLNFFTIVLVIIVVIRCYYYCLLVAWVCVRTCKLIGLFGQLLIVLFASIHASCGCSCCSLFLLLLLLLMLLLSLCCYLQLLSLSLLFLLFKPRVIWFIWACLKNVLNNNCENKNLIINLLRFHKIRCICYCNLFSKRSEFASLNLCVWLWISKAETKRKKKGGSWKSGVSRARTPDLYNLDLY